MWRCFAPKGAYIWAKICVRPTFPTLARPSPAYVMSYRVLGRSYLRVVVPPPPSRLSEVYRVIMHCIPGLASSGRCFLIPARTASYKWFPQRLFKRSTRELS